MQLNASRIKVLQAQDDLVSAMREAASKDLLNVSHHKFHHHHNYEGLLKSLIVQVLIKLGSYYVNFLIPYNSITPCFLKYGLSFVSVSCSFLFLHFMLFFYELVAGGTCNIYVFQFHLFFSFMYESFNQHISSYCKGIPVDVIAINSCYFTNIMINEIAEMQCNFLVN